MRELRQRSQPNDRYLQKQQGVHEDCTAADVDWNEKPVEQPHVVEEWQPGHRRAALMRPEALTDLLEVPLQGAVSDNDTCRNRG